MDEKVTLAEWVKDAPQEELNELIEKTKKRFWIFFLISLIPYVNFITMGFTIFCYNNWCFLKSRGARTGNQYIVLLLMLWGFFIPPLIGVWLCSKSEKLGSKILGW